MYVENTINELIEVGWCLLNTSMDEAAIPLWKTQTLDCLISLLGPDHLYVTHIKDFFRKAERDRLLAGTGILTAAREELAGKAKCCLLLCECNVTDIEGRAL